MSHATEHAPCWRWLALLPLVACAVSAWVLFAPLLQMADHRVLFPFASFTTETLPVRQALGVASAPYDPREFAAPMPVQLRGAHSARAADSGPGDRCRRVAGNARSGHS